jgi:hypothetical protein
VLFETVFFGYFWLFSLFFSYFFLSFAFFLFVFFSRLFFFLTFLFNFCIISSMCPNIFCFCYSFVCFSAC